MQTSDQRHAPALPAATTVGRVRLRVRDLDRALAFYGDFLGFREIEREDSSAKIKAGGELLFELREVPGIGPAPRRAAGLYHAAILLPERSDLARISRHFIENEFPFGQADHAVSEALYLDDPDGNGLEIYVDRPRDEWPMVGNSVQMVTDPIDFHGLLGLLMGEDDRWEAMPDGTTIGHIHLRVSDLDQARAFYVDTLGFDVMQDNFRGALFVSAGGYHHHLGMNIWESHGQRVAGQDVAGLDRFAIILPDRESWAEVVARIAEHAPDSGDTFLGHDPDGIEFELTYAR